MDRGKHFGRFAWITLAALLLITVAMPVYGYDYMFKPIDGKFDEIAEKLADLDYRNERDKVNPKDLSALDEIAKKSNNNQLKARAIYWHVRMSQLNAEPLKCKPMLEEALRLCGKDYTYDRALLQYQLAGNCERLADYLNSYKLLQESIDGLTESGDDYFLGNAYLLMAQLYVDINDLISAKEQLRLARDSYVAAKFPLNRIYFFQAQLAGGREALNLYKKSVETGKNDWGMTIQAYMSLSSSYLAMGKIDSAAYYNSKGIEVLKRDCPDNILFSSLLNVNRIKVLYAEGKYDEALVMLNDLVKIDGKIKQERFAIDIFKYLWLVHDKLGHKAEAYAYLVKYQSLYEAYQTALSRQDVPKMRAAQAIADIKKEAENNKMMLYLTILISLVVILIIAALTIYFYQRYRINKIENRELRGNLEKEALIYSVNRQNFQRDMQQKEREISSSTLLLTNKNEVLRQISDITKEYSDKGQIPIAYVRQVNNVIGESLKNDDEWSRFRLQFDSVHPDFFNKLKQTSDELTENDLRLCAYIRIGLRPKQISGMLNISPDSVNSNRYRLRKKLGLQHGESLDDFLRKI